eukprot:CFRG3729T1
MASTEYPVNMNLDVSTRTREASSEQACIDPETLAQVPLLPVFAIDFDPQLPMLKSVSCSSEQTQQYYSSHEQEQLQTAQLPIFDHANSDILAQMNSVMMAKSSAEAVSGVSSETTCPEIARFRAGSDIGVNIGEGYNENNTLPSGPFSNIWLGKNPVDMSTFLSHSTDHQNQNLACQQPNTQALNQQQHQHFMDQATSPSDCGGAHTDTFTSPTANGGHVSSSSNNSLSSPPVPLLTSEDDEMDYIDSLNQVFFGDMDMNNGRNNYLCGYESTGVSQHLSVQNTNNFKPSLDTTNVASSISPSILFSQTTAPESKIFGPIPIHQQEQPLSSEYERRNSKPNPNLVYQNSTPFALLNSKSVNDKEQTSKTKQPIAQNVSTKSLNQNSYENVQNVDKLKRGGKDVDFTLQDRAKDVEFRSNSKRKQATERKRIQSISEAFDVLKNLVPTCAGAKAARVTILQRTANHICAQNKTVADLKARLELITSENDRLKLSLGVNTPACTSRSGGRMILSGPNFAPTPMRYYQSVPKRASTQTHSQRCIDVGASTNVSGGTGMDSDINGGSSVITAHSTSDICSTVSTNTGSDNDVSRQHNGESGGLCAQGLTAQPLNVNAGVVPGVSACVDGGRDEDATSNRFMLPMKRKLAHSGTGASIEENEVIADIQGLPRKHSRSHAHVQTANMRIDESMAAGANVELASLPSIDFKYDTHSIHDLTSYLFQGPGLPQSKEPEHSQQHIPQQTKADPVLSAIVFPNTSESLNSNIPEIPTYSSLNAHLLQPQTPVQPQSQLAHPQAQQTAQRMEDTVSSDADSTISLPVHRTGRYGGGNTRTLMSLCLFLLMSPTSRWIMESMEEITNINPTGRVLNSMNGSHRFGGNISNVILFLLSRALPHFLLCLRSLSALLFARIVLLISEPSSFMKKCDLEKVKRMREEMEREFSQGNVSEAEKIAIEGLAICGHHPLKLSGLKLLCNWLTQCGHHQLRNWRIGAWVDSIVLSPRDVSPLREVAYLYFCLYLIKVFYRGQDDLQAIHLQCCGLNYAEVCDARYPKDTLLTQIYVSCTFAMERLFPQFHYISKFYQHRALSRVLKYGHNHMKKVEDIKLFQDERSASCRLQAFPGLLIISLLLVGASIIQFTTHMFEMEESASNPIVKYLMIIPTILLLPLAVLTCFPP